MRHAPWGLIDKIRGGMRTPWLMAMVILHLLGYNCNLYAGVGDQLKALNVSSLTALKSFKKANVFITGKDNFTFKRSVVNNLRVAKAESSLLH